ncbi:MAG: NADH:flavin oxidoreductase/NADH oxidase family protein [Corynebacterium sp.]|uniref:NADH:flavin oxidoreductase/NADH oxidase family protein n=1 Tax=unclassified Corynebacterium TaxID=2624378 RepID=UPI0026475A70|nr:NADH:flavin oxidoreductase/NADH oxidase family protein [Corynebacterium sp.]MDN5719479.1 NADH:flavin oxidoreductase/NADH oxidase family protein [Corynebacterium sp.]MDN6258269.1 NADH:flavin oxidoreductase/NADH oxidase family protein [Corynebacterium sp.]MDN6324190.1 NADH:flavin oxidoreductase/NADH oxidase family protein [Corynebacterium sp.]MDN6386274.1 NADH:flavin oxidoreductase/NADH oxidase family protein [Corynebacterium sp.]
MTPTTVAAPLDLPCGTTLKNRLVKASTSEGLAAASWGPSNQHLDLYRRWADGGAGLVITGAVMVDAEHRADPDSVVVTDDRHLDKLRAWATAGTANDTELWMQIDHPGRQSPRSINKFPVAPSAVPMSGRIARYFGEPRELTVSDIEMLVWRFGYTALIARETGFTGVQIQAGHGNLISEFLSPASNLRTDEYGGDLDGRMRVLLDVYRAVREQVGESFPVSVKINSTDGIPGGFSEDESLEVAKKLSEIGVDVIEISGGTYVEPLMQGDEFDASGATGEIFFGDHARRVHEAIDTPVMVTGGFRCAADIEKGLEEGMGDLIGMARPMVLIPELANEIIVHGSRERVRLPRLTTHLNSLDDVTESLVGTAWYQMQMDRITDGRSIGGDGLAALWTVAKRHGVRSVLPRRK